VPLLPGPVGEWRGFQGLPPNGRRRLASREITESSSTIAPSASQGQAFNVRFPMI